ncbi:MAG: HlyD family efflux transporter periplasmic adaptor subunit [Bacteroidales bacterium]|nr:HlyD family efflux transporter periplasmic adaptor subunit [Bacteroidales bacterium]MBN2632951.1 HlyD family efflux transporter periplasmic adaptor subunit [Bacteroidales bacterium]
MKRTILTTIAVVVVATIVLLIINSIFSKKDDLNIYAEAREGIFEITVSNAGELLAENSTDIYGPQLVESSEEQQGGSQQRGGSQRGGGRPGGMSGGGRGGDFHMMDFKITDIVAEGTIVKKGDYVAQLDRTNYQNTLTDARESLKTLQENLELKILDTAMSLTSLRDAIKNQRYSVEEAEIDLEQSKYEPPAVKRKAETKLNTQQRALEQLLQSYNLRKIQIATDIRSQKLALEDQELLVQNLENFLAQFTVRAPSDGMIIYKKDRLGNKRIAGSSINPFDNVIATLPDLSSMLSKMYVNEIEVIKVNPGLKVNITVDALPDKSYTGTVLSVANVGEQLPNSDAKMFEVMIKVDVFDPALRPAMTTWNKIILKTIPMAVYVPLDCVHTGSDSITYVYKKNKTKQVVVLGEFNDKHVIIKEGLEPGTLVYIIEPEGAEEFRITGKELITQSKDY